MLCPWERNFTRLSPPKQGLKGYPTTDSESIVKRYEPDMEKRYIWMLIINNYFTPTKLNGSGGIRTHASEETGALNQRLRPLGHATSAFIADHKCHGFCYRWLAVNVETIHALTVMRRKQFLNEHFSYTGLNT